jgi:hypothetical protein
MGYNGKTISIIGLCVLIVGALGALAIVQSESHDQDGGAAEVEVARLDPKSSPLLLVYEAFLNSGWSSEQASFHAHRALGLPVEVLDEAAMHAPPATAAGRVLLDPKSSPLLIVYEELFKSGWSAEEASKHAHEMLGLAMQSGQCAVYPTKVVYCNGPNKVQLRLFMNALCWEGTLGNNGLSECIIACQFGEIVWLTLTVQQGCDDLPLPGTCVWLTVTGPSTTINCNEINIQCSCFEETDGTVNCSEIEGFCCSATTIGCAGCPDCD